MDKVKEWTEQLKDRWQNAKLLKKMIVVLFRYQRSRNHSSCLLFKYAN